MIREESSGSVQQRLQMITRNLDRRLERLEGHLKPPASRALLILVARIGEPNRIITITYEAHRLAPRIRPKGGR
jgi:hypothetical protein